MFRLAWKKAVSTIIPKMVQRKHQEIFPAPPEKIKKVKILSKLFFQLPIWRQKRILDNKAANFPPQIRHFLAQSRKLFHKVNIMFWSKCLTGHMKFNFDNFVENFLTKVEKSSLKLDTKLKKKSFLKKNSSKSFRTFRMQFWQNWRNFFFKTKIFCRSKTKSNETWQNFAKNREVLWTRRMQFGQRCWNLSAEVWRIIAQSPKTILKN